MQLSELKKQIGLLRSVVMYYWKPLNGRRLRRFYSQFIGPGDLCFDIGAHIGNRTNAWLGLGARVVAVEPQEHCINYMRRRFGGKPGVTLVSKAIGARPGTATLHVSRMTPTISTLSDDEWRSQINADAWYTVNWEDQVRVDVITLDQLIEQYGVPVFCKIDVENHEVEVLEGLSSPVTALSFEYYPPYTDRAVSCVRMIQRLGRYSFNWSFGETQKFNSEAWLDSDTMCGILSGYSQKRHYGDVYAKLTE